MSTTQQNSEGGLVLGASDWYEGDEATALLGPLAAHPAATNTQSSTHPLQCPSYPGLSYRTETVQRTSYICTRQGCNKRFSRLYDLHRHHRGAHDKLAQYPCRHDGCPRKVRGFPRKDKRDEHERKIHGVARQ